MPLAMLYGVPPIRSKFPIHNDNCKKEKDIKLCTYCKDKINLDDKVCPHCGKN